MTPIPYSARHTSTCDGVPATGKIERRIQRHGDDMQRDANPPRLILAEIPSVIS